MQTTDLTTKDSDINVILGDYTFGEDPRQEAFGFLKYLYTDLTDIRKYYIRLGFHLDEFKRCEYYKDFGYLTFEEFCDVNLCLNKGAVSRCMNVYREFNAKNDVERMGNYESRGSAMDLSERWKDYSYTQLCELLPLTEDQRRGITPDMTVKQIREYKKSLKDKPVASTQPKKPFDKKKYDNTMGAARQNVVRSCSAINDNVIFNVYDKNGKFLGGNIWCEFIYKSGYEYYFRLCQARDENQED